MAPHKCFDEQNVWLHYVIGAKMMYHLDPSTQAKGIALATNLSPEMNECTVLVSPVFRWFREFVCLESFNRRDLRCS